MIGFMLYRARNLYYCLFISFQNFRLIKQRGERRFKEGVGKEREQESDRKIDR